MTAAKKKAHATTTTRRGRARSAVNAPTFPLEEMKAALGKRDGRSQRAAYYLNWAAEHFPYQYQPFNVILQQINGRRSLPRIDSQEVWAMRRSAATIRKILQREPYNRTLDVAGNGARATVDDDDRAATSMPKSLKRLRSAKNATMAVHGLIDPTKVRDARLRAWLQSDVHDVVRAIGKAAFDKKLLPPPTED